MARRGRPAERRRRHRPQPRRGGAARGRAAVLRHPGLPRHARRARRADRALRRADRGRARRRARDQVRARRPDPRRRARHRHRDGGGRLRRCSRPPTPACARACSSRRCSASRRWSRTCAAATVRNLAAQYDTDFAHAEHVARLALELWDALAAAGAAPRRPEGARAAVGDRDAARHRHRGRLRRPPQALALPDPQRRPAGLQPARGRR